MTPDVQDIRPDGPQILADLFVNSGMGILMPYESFTKQEVRFL